jgi:hypothetical protein
VINANDCASHELSLAFPLVPIGRSTQVHSRTPLAATPHHWTPIFCTCQAPHRRPARLGVRPSFSSSPSPSISIFTTISLTRPSSEHAVIPYINDGLSVTFKHNSRLDLPSRTSSHLATAPPPPSIMPSIASVVTTTVTKVASSSVSPSATQRATPQGGILEGSNPSKYDPKNPIFLFIIQVCCTSILYPPAPLQRNDTIGVEDSIGYL